MLRDFKISHSETQCDRDSNDQYSINWTRSIEFIRYIKYIHRPISNVAPNQVNSTISTTSTASACSETSVISKRYVRSQFPITTTVIPENSETKIPDTTVRRSQKRAVRTPPKHWYIKDRLKKLIKERDYRDFIHTMIKGKVSHKDLAATIGKEALLKDTRGWNQCWWNWNTMEKFHKKRENRERRSHPYQSEERKRDRGGGGSGTIGKE